MYGYGGLTVLNSAAASALKQPQMIPKGLGITSFGPGVGLGGGAFASFCKNSALIRLPTRPRLGIRTPSSQHCPPAWMLW